MYNDKLKEKKISLSNKQHMLRKHYTSLKDTNKKVICSQDLYNNEWQAKKLYYFCAKSGKIKWSASKNKQTLAKAKATV